VVLFSSTSFINSGVLPVFSAMLSLVRLLNFLKLRNFEPKSEPSASLSIILESARDLMAVFLINFVNTGIKTAISAAIPRFANLNIGAFISLLMATTNFAFVMPAVYCTAPEVPAVIKSSGFMVFPVCPINLSSSIQCQNTGGLVAPISAPSAEANFLSSLNPSILPAPAPPTTIFLAFSRLLPECFIFSLETSFKRHLTDGSNLILWILFAGSRASFF